MNEFKLNFKIIPIVIAKQAGTKKWEAKLIVAGRKKKVCNICNKKIDISESSITFSRRTNGSFETIYTCKKMCAKRKATQLAFTAEEALDIGRL